MDFRPDGELPRESGGHFRRPRPRRHRRRECRQRHRRRQRRRAARHLRCRRYRPDRLHRRRLRRSRHRDARVPRARRLNPHHRGLGHHHRPGRGRGGGRAGRAALRRHHARVRPRDRTRALAGERPLFPQPAGRGLGTARRPRARRAGPVRGERHRLSGRGPGRDHVPVHRPVSVEPALQQPRNGDGERRRRQGGARLALPVGRISASAPARSPGAWWRRTARVR